MVVNCAVLQAGNAVLISENPRLVELVDESIIILSRRDFAVAFDFERAGCGWEGYVSTTNILLGVLECDRRVVPVMARLRDWATVESHLG